MSPTLNFRKKLPILIQTGGHKKQSQMDLEVEDLRRVLVRVDLTNWDIQLIYFMMMYLPLDGLIPLRILKI